MLDIKFIREHADEVKQNLVNRHNPFDLDKVLELDGKRRELLQETEALKSEKNAESKKIAQAKKNGEDAADAIASMREVGKKISAIDKELGEVEGTLNELLLHIPNMADKSVPIGKDDSENPEVRRWGEIPKFDFPIKAHYELGDELGILDAERAGKVSGARVLGYSLAGSVLFFLVTNFGTWLGGSMYPQDASGLLAAYVAGIPFFQWTVAGTLFYAALLFGGFELLRRRNPALHAQTA